MTTHPHRNVRKKLTPAHVASFSEEKIKRGGKNGGQFNKKAHKNLNNLKSFKKYANLVCDPVSELNSCQGLNAIIFLLTDKSSFRVTDNNLFKR